jgi:NitT/TauT family transport system substrate-binding protein
MRKITGLLLAFLIIFMTPGCTAVEEKGPVKISINVWPGYAHAFIAQEKGFFEKNDVDVKLILKKNISESAELYKNGEADGFFDVWTDVVMINSEGIPTQVVYVADYSDSGDVIIGRPELKSLFDLKGKTVSFEGVNTFWLFNAFIR